MNEWMTNVIDIYGKLRALSFVRRNTKPETTSAYKVCTWGFEWKRGKIKLYYVTIHKSRVKKPCYNWNNWKKLIFCMRRSFFIVWKYTIPINKLTL